MPTKHCVNCGGAIDVHPDDAIITCGYCGVSFAPDGKQFKEHFALKVNYSEKDALDTLKAYLVKVPGVPNDLATQISLKEIRMVYYPFWVYNVQGRVAYRGRDRKAHFRDAVGHRFTSLHWEWVEEAGQQEQTRQIRLYAGPQVRKEIQTYPIATRSRRFFNLEEAKEHTANVLFSKVPEEAARQNAVAETRNMIFDRIRRETAEVAQVREEFNVTDHAYIHVPIYHVIYTVGGGKVYEAALDASNGRVLFTQIPRTTGFKLKSIITAIIWFGIAGAGAIVTLLTQYFYAGVGLAIIAGVVGLLTLILTFRGVTAEKAR
ncbi:MAG: hypothetical protein ACFFDP_01985 [Promethearchaeota archaeon]